MTISLIARKVTEIRLVLSYLLVLVFVLSCFCVNSCYAADPSKDQSNRLIFPPEPFQCNIGVEIVPCLQRLVYDLNNCQDPREGYQQYIRNLKNAYNGGFFPGEITTNLDWAHITEVNSRGLSDRFAQSSWFMYPQKEGRPGRIKFPELSFFNFDPENLSDAQRGFKNRAINLAMEEAIHAWQYHIGADDALVYTPAYAELLSRTKQKFCHEVFVTAFLDEYLGVTHSEDETRIYNRKWYVENRNPELLRNPRPQSRYRPPPVCPPKALTALQPRNYANVASNALDAGQNVFVIMELFDQTLNSENPLETTTYLSEISLLASATAYSSASAAYAGGLTETSAVLTAGGGALGSTGACGATAVVGYCAGRGLDYCTGNRLSSGIAATIGWIGETFGALPEGTGSTAWHRRNSEFWGY